MPYVRRDADGRIAVLQRDADAAATEYLSAHSPEVAAFLDQAVVPEAFDGLDAELVRVLEDLIDVLIVKNVIRLTDLPQEAQQKIFSRKHFREHLRQPQNILFPKDDDGLI